MLTDVIVAAANVVAVYVADVDAVAADVVVPVFANVGCVIVVVFMVSVLFLLLIIQGGIHVGSAPEVKSSFFTLRRLRRQNGLC